MNQEKIQVLAQLNEMIDQTKGKVFMGMVHQIYGPLRGLNFILINAQAEDIMNSIDEQAVEMDAELQMKIIEEIKEGKELNSLIDIVFVFTLRKEQKYKKWPGLTHTNKKYYNKQKNN